MSGRDSPGDWPDNRTHDSEGYPIPKPRGDCPSCGHGHLRHGSHGRHDWVECDSCRYSTK